MKADRLERGGTIRLRSGFNKRTHEKKSLNALTSILTLIMLHLTLLKPFILSLGNCKTWKTSTCETENFKCLWYNVLVQGGYLSRLCMFYSTLNKQWICASVCVGAHILYAQHMVTYNKWNQAHLITATMCVCVCVGQETHCMQIAIPLRVCPFGRACVSVCLPRGAPHVEVRLPSGCLAARCAGTRWVSVPSSTLNHAHLTWLPVALPSPVLVILKVFS